MKRPYAMTASGRVLIASMVERCAWSVTPFTGPAARSLAEPICGHRPITTALRPTFPSADENQGPGSDIRPVQSEETKTKSKARKIMADKNERLPQNVPGAWYVDSNCIDCDLCRETAPTVFRRDDDAGNSIVFHQPESDEEKTLAEEAKAGCPVEAIGSDGAVDDGANKSRETIANDPMHNC